MGDRPGPDFAPARPQPLASPADIESARVNFVRLMPSTAERVGVIWKTRPMLPPALRLSSCNQRSDPLPIPKPARYASLQRRGTASPGECSMLTEAEIQSHAERIRDDGYTVIDARLSPNWSRD